HFLMAGWFQYFFARTLKLPPVAALLSAVAFAFSGMFLSMPINFTIFRSIVWIPLIFMFMTLGAKRNSLAFPLLAAIAMVFQMMGGSLQVTGITVLALIPYMVFLALSPEKGKQASLVPFLQFVLLLMLAVGLYAFQLLPTLELTGKAWRGTQAGYDLASSFSFWPIHFIDSVFPYFFGKWVDGSLIPTVPDLSNVVPYLGLVPLFLIPLAFGSKKRGVGIMLFLVVLFLALAIGKYGLIYKAVYDTVPFFDQFRAPERFWYIAIFAGSLLAGFGLDMLMNLVESESKAITPASAGLVAFIGLLVVGFLVGTIMLPVIKPIWGGFVNLFAGLFFNTSNLSFDQSIYTKWKSDLIWVFLHAFAVVTLFHLAIALFGRKGRAGLLAGAIVAVAIADLYVLSFQIPALKTTSASFFTSPPRSAEVLMRDGENPRFYSFARRYYAQTIFKFPDDFDDTLWYNGGGSNSIADYIALREELSPNIHMHWGLRSANGFASLFLDRYFKLEGPSDNQLLPFLKGGNPGPVPLEDWQNRTLLIDLFSAKYVLSPIEFAPTDRFSLVDDGPIKVYANRKALPRAWITKPERIMGETDDTMNKLKAGEIDPLHTLILSPLPERIPPGNTGTELKATARVRLSGASGSGGGGGGSGQASSRGGALIDEQVFVDINSSESAYLILADTWFRGWVAEIDGVPSEKIYRAFGYFRAIEIPPGEHIVRFFYKPKSFSLGVTLTLITIVTLIMLSIIQGLFFSRSKRKRSNSEH
ncbi:MAG: hypothetical protein ABIC40_07685, partial [bacterium]